MLNLEKERFIGNIVLKRSFQMALMSVKNLVYNKLARQNIFFALLIQFWFLLFWLTVIIIYILILILIIITIDFIVLLLLLYFIFVTVIIIIVLSIINVIYFILSHFISYCSYYYDFCLCVVCDVYVSHFFFLFPFLVYDLHFILALLIHVKNHFSLAIIVYIIIVIITTILFFSTLPVIGGEFSKWIRAAWSTLTHLLWVSRRVSIIFVFILFYFFC